MLAAGALSHGDRASPALAFRVVALGMIAGSVLGGQRVARVLAERVTVMDDRSGFTANLATSLLVSLGAVGGLPLSTTHVSSGAIVGAGAHRGPRALDRGTL